MPAGAVLRILIGIESQEWGVRFDVSRRGARKGITFFFHWFETWGGGGAGFLLQRTVSHCPHRATRLSVAVLQ
jgi:hypothetical protein